MNTSVIVFIFLSANIGILFELAQIICVKFYTVFTSLGNVSD